MDTIFSFHIMTFVNGAAVNMGTQMALQHKYFIVFGEIPNNGVAGSCDSSICNFF